MEYIYASLLLHSAGKEISEESLKRVLEAAGIPIDEVRVKMIVTALKEVNIADVIRQATGFAPAVAIQPAAATPVQAQTKPPEEKKEEEKKEEVGEEAIAEGISALFG
ncbi:MAG: 50S ribosomal protein P1 [Sulfolobales archaeon]|nr:50S ribosomal protein P1 [Sulfolobales archaeon]MCX8208968.1 50S ribosomal protein P1 [Sulfolobales archaeon]MDW8010691.1 50S ribosomal protein P1 [Sulfolobales archaeon]